MIAHQILETKLINQYDKMYHIFAQDNTLKLNLSNDNIINGIIQDVKADNVNSTYRKEILTPYDTLSTGDYITHTSNGKNIIYIAESQVDKEIGCDKFYLLECPLSVNIFDWNYSDIKTYPISLKNNNASLAIKENAIMITNNSSFEIIIKYDENTRSFVQSGNMINGIEHAMISRILIDGMPFSRVGANHLINKGILVINIENGMPDQSNDNLELEVADYYKHYIKPTDYNKLVNDEMLKYETNVTVTKDILANEIIDDIVKKLRYGQTENESVNVVISEVDADNLLTLNDGVIRLTSQLSFENLDNTTTATLTFSAGDISKTLVVNVTIEKQSEILPDDITVENEVSKYETTAFVSNTIPTGSDITSTIMKLKADMVANPEVSTIITSVDTDNLLTLNGGITTLTNQLAFDASDTSSFAIITFTKGEVVRTLTIDVTIEKLLPQSDFEFAVAEVLKYENTANIPNTVLAGENITSLVMRLKDGEIANPEVDVYCSWVDEDGLLTLSNRVLTLTNIIPSTATDNETLVQITFKKGDGLRSLIVNVTIEKQDEVAPPDLEIYCEWEDIEIGGTNDYTINTVEPVTWTLTNVNNALTLTTNGTSNACQVSCKGETKYIGKTELLTATVNGFEYYYTVIIVGLI